MRVSRNEFCATIEKAARGGGWPLGVAQDLALAAVWAMGTGHAATKEVILATQTAPLRPSVHHMNGHSAVFLNGASGISCAIDLVLSTRQPVQVFGLDCPLLAQGYAGQAGAHFGIGIKLDLSGATPTLIPGGGAPLHPPSTGAIDIDSAQWHKLLALAARVYVAATDRSRDGAGAGLHDND